MLREMCFVLGTLGCASVSLGGASIIDFDDIELTPGLPGTMWENDRYADQGVHFFPAFNSEMYAQSDFHVASAPNAIYASSVGGLNSNAFFTVLFEDLQSFVSFFVIDYTDEANTWGEWRVTIWTDDPDSALPPFEGGITELGEVTGTGSFLAGEGLVEWSDASTQIRGFTFWPSEENESIDTLVFGIPTPGTVGLLGLAALAGLRRRR